MSYLDAVPNLGAQPSLKQLAYETLQRQIINGQLQPGSRLTEEELSRSMSISRAPIREALNMLERDGFTKIIPRRGAVVTDVSRQDVINIWEVRALLEPYAARCSVGLVPKEELERILARLDRMAETPEQFDNYTDLDLEIHALLPTIRSTPTGCAGSAADGSSRTRSSCVSSTIKSTGRLSWPCFRESPTPSMRRSGSML